MVLFTGLKSSFLKFLRFKNHYIVVTAVLSLIFTAIFNIPLWRSVIEIIAEDSNLPLYFKLSVPLAVYALMTMIFLLLFSYRYLLKPVFTVLLVSGAMAAYASWAYKARFDRTMIRTILETNWAEASSYSSWVSLAVVFGLGVIPSVILWSMKIYYPRLVISMLQRFAASLVCLAAAAVLIIPNYQYYTYVGRGHRYLRHEILPISYVYASASLIKRSFFDSKTPYVAMGSDISVTGTTDKPKLLLVVIGETARAQNFQALGYERDTNAYTKPLNLINFANVFSCGTMTSYSLPCMFSNLRRKDFSEKLAENREGIADLLNKAGINVTWVDNDSGCKGVCNRIKVVKIEDDKRYCKGGTCYDEILLDYAANLTSDIKKDSVIFRHIIGSHGPRYYERYPEEFKLYTPDCNRPDIENCPLNQLVNAYDNSIAYTDYVIAKLITQVLTPLSSSTYPMLLYVSDHGESLGEGGFFLHGTPYAFAPEEQTRIPMQVYLPDGTANALKLDKSCLIKKAAQDDFSHDNFFHSLMALMQITSAEYEKDLDIFNGCKM